MNNAIINLIRYWSALKSRPQSNINKKYGWKYWNDKKQKEIRNVKLKDALIFSIGFIIFTAFMFYSGQA